MTSGSPTLVRGQAAGSQGWPRRQDLLPALSYLVGALLVAGATELLLLRVLSRLGVHIPKEGLLLQAFTLLTGLGSFAFDLATVLGVMALALAAYVAWTVGRRGPLATLAFAGLALLLLWGLLLPLVGKDDATSLAFASTSLAVMALLAVDYVGQGRVPGWRRLAVALVVAAYACSQYYVVAHNAYALLGLSALPPHARDIFGLGEALVLLNGLVVFWAWGRPLRWGFRLLPATAVSLLLLLSYLGNTSTSAILALWTEGLTLHLPLPFYLLSFWLYLVTVTACLRHQRTFWQGAALILLFIAGYTLEMTYQHLLAVLAVLLLTQEAAWQEPAASAPHPAT